jgi:starvation-inducible DNA-binding protein
VAMYCWTWNCDRGRQPSGLLSRGKRRVRCLLSPGHKPGASWCHRQTLSKPAREGPTGSRFIVLLALHFLQENHMPNTRIDLPASSRSKVSAILNARLADLLDLRAAVKQAHWNVRGPQFIAVHEMLDTFADQLDAETDTIAERVGQLGELAEGTTQQVGKATTLKPYPTRITSVGDHLKALADRLAQAAKLMRLAIEETDDLDDEGSSDIVTATSRVLDKQLWFVESHLN